MGLVDMWIRGYVIVAGLSLVAAGCGQTETVVATASQVSAEPEVAAPATPVPAGETPEWLINGDPIPPSETVPPPQPGDIVSDEITPIDEALAAEAATHETVDTISAEEFDRGAAPSLAKNLGISEEEVLIRLTLLREVGGEDSSGAGILDNAVKDWLGAGYAGSWIEWDPEKPLFQYAYIGDLPASDPPSQLADLIAAGDAQLGKVEYLDSELQEFQVLMLEEVSRLGYEQAAVLLELTSNDVLVYVLPEYDTASLEVMAQEFASSRNRIRSPLRITVVTDAMIAESEKNRAD
jgi:hypothetical protein